MSTWAGHFLPTIVFQLLFFSSRGDPKLIYDNFNKHLKKIDKTENV